MHACAVVVDEDGDGEVRFWNDRKIGVEARAHASVVVEVVGRSTIRVGLEEVTVAVGGTIGCLRTTNGVTSIAD
jgi:hypothetical protein